MAHTKGDRDIPTPEPKAHTLSYQTQSIHGTQNSHSIPVENLGLSVRTYRALQRGGIFTSDQLSSLSDESIRAIHNVGPSAAIEIQLALERISEIASTQLSAVATPNTLILLESSQRVSDTPLEVLDLPIRCYNALRRARYYFVEQLLPLHDEELMKVRNLGQQSLVTLRSALDRFLAEHPDFARADLGQTAHTTGIQTPKSKSALDTSSVQSEQAPFTDWSTVVERQRDENGLPVEYQKPTTQSRLRLESPLLDTGSVQSEQAPFTDWSTVVERQRDEKGLPVEYQKPMAQSRLRLESPPTGSLVGSETVNFLLRLGCPLGQIPADRLTVNGAYRTYFAQVGLSTALQIFQASRTRLQASPAGGQLESLISDIEYYIQWLGSQSDWSSEVQCSEPSPVAIFHLRKEDWSLQLTRFLSRLNDRERHIITMHYSLQRESPWTLQEIADQLSISRARVQQLNTRAIHRLRLNLKLHEPLRAFIGLCQRILDQRRLISTSALIAELSRYLLVGSRLTGHQLRLLVVEITEDAKYVGDLDIFLSKEVDRKEVDELIHGIRRILHQSGAPVRLDDLIHAIQHSALADGRPTNELIMSCLHSMPDFVNTEESYWGLESLDGHIGNNLVMILRQLGRPVHFRELTERLNERLPEDTRKSERTVAAYLQRVTSLFIRTGPGTFGLRENHPDLPNQPTKYVDLIEQVLEKADRPLNIDEVFHLVSERRAAKRTSIQIYLSTDPRFCKFGSTQYGLATWQDSNQSPLPVQEPRSKRESDDDFAEDLKQQVLRWLQQQM